ncbi:hypothetical protein [Streptomyces sp. A012304]|nr:hypothetical protein [Streptomyces sp. A012304]
MRTSHRFLLGLVLGATITVIVWSSTGNAEAAITLGVTVLLLV